MHVFNRYLKEETFESNLIISYDICRRNMWKKKYYEEKYIPILEKYYYFPKT